MKKILVSGLINMETTVKVRQFPINYYPIDYPFFGIHTNVSGVAYNIARALKTLGDDITFFSMLGNDDNSEQIIKKLNESSISTEYILKILAETPSSVVLYDEEGKRQIYCDLKDIQDKLYPCNNSALNDCDMVVACNTNFNRELLKKAKEQGKIIATDVHVLSDINDEYNKDFMAYADILFLSDEAISSEPKDFLTQIKEEYQNSIIVLGRGSKGVLMYIKEEDKFFELPAVCVGNVINTVGAGDALFSSFLHFYQKGFTPLESLKRAEIFASYKIGFYGGAIGFLEEDKVEELYLKKKAEFLL